MHSDWMLGYLSMDSTQSAMMDLLAVMLCVIEAAILFCSFCRGASMSLASLSSWAHSS